MKNKIDLEQMWRRTIWSDDTVDNESVMVLKNSDGIVEPISLLYPIECVISVRDSSLKITYEENVDYQVKDGKLIVLRESKIPTTDYDNYYLNERLEENSFETLNGGYVYYAEGDYFHKKQIAVTYRHNGVWSGSIPSGQRNRIKNTVERLEAKQALNIVFYGDSITVGSNSSAYINVEPFIPTWSELVTESLKNKYGYEEIKQVNSAVGSTGIVWGLENVQERVVEHKPDLVVIGFGMNDYVSADIYKSYIEKMILEIKRHNLTCEIILVAPMLPNLEVKNIYFYQKDYVTALEEIAQSNKGIAVADVTSVHSQLLEKKRYCDMTGNNLNHPNDFLARIYLQVIMKIFEDKDK